MKYLLDTNACITHLRSGGKSALSQKLFSSNLSEIGVCSIVRAELVMGALHGQTPSRDVPLVVSFLDLFDSLPFDDAAADQYAEAWAALAKQGRPVGSNDLMIGAIARVHGLIVITHNAVDFGKIPGLLMEDWEMTVP